MRSAGHLFGTSAVTDISSVSDSVVSLLDSTLIVLLSSTARVSYLFEHICIVCFVTADAFHSLSVDDLTLVFVSKS